MKCLNENGFAKARRLFFIHLFRFEEINLYSDDYDYAMLQLVKGSVNISNRNTYLFKVLNFAGRREGF